MNLILDRRDDQQYHLQDRTTLVTGCQAKIIAGNHCLIFAGNDAKIIAGQGCIIVCGWWCRLMGLISQHTYICAGHDTCALVDRVTWHFTGKGKGCLVPSTFYYFEKWPTPYQTSPFCDLPELAKQEIQAMGVAPNDWKL